MSEWRTGKCQTCKLSMYEGSGFSLSLLLSEGECRQLRLFFSPCLLVGFCSTLSQTRSSLTQNLSKGSKRGALWSNFAGGSQSLGNGPFGKTWADEKPPTTSNQRSPRFLRCDDQCLSELDSSRSYLRKIRHPRMSRFRHVHMAHVVPASVPMYVNGAFILQGPHCQQQ